MHNKKLLTTSSVSPEPEDIPPLPVSSLGRPLLVGPVPESPQPSVLPAGGGQTTLLPSLVGGRAQPVDAGVVLDGVVSDIDHDDLIIFIGSVLSNPVGVEHAESTESPPDAVLSKRPQVPAEGEPNTLSNGLSVDDTLSDSLLPSASPDADTIDAETLLSLEAESVGLVRAGGPGASVDGGELAVFPAPHTEDEFHGIGLLALPELFEEFVATHSAC